MKIFRRVGDWAKNSISTTPLHKAADEQDLSKLQWEVQRQRGLIDAQEQSMLWTPLHIAAFKGSDAIVRELLARGARHDIADKEGRTALHLGAMNGFTRVVDALLKRGASTSVRDKSGNAPYDYAVQHHPTVAAMLGAPPPPLPSGAPRIDLPAASTASGNQLLQPPPPPASPASLGANGSAFPRVSYDALPINPLLPPPKPKPAPEPYPTPPAVTAMPVAGMYEKGWYGGGGSGSTAAAGPSAPPYTLGTPYAPAGQHPQYGHGQPYAPPANHIPYPAVPSVHPSQSPHRPSDGPQWHGNPGGGAGAGVAVQAPYAQPPPAKPPPPPPPPLQLPPWPGSTTSSLGGLTPDAGRAVHSGGSSSGGARTSGTATPGRGAAASGGGGAAGTAADLDWGPTRPTDWGGDADIPSPGRHRLGRSNPIMSARYQLERLLGAGLAQLGIGGAAATTANEGTAAAAGSGLSAASTTSARSAGSAVRGRLYSYEALRVATGGFSPLNKLGEGGYGPVYQGMLDGIPVAIKVMDTSTGCMQGRTEFEAEVAILSDLHHPHVVLLIGSCPEKGMLVYELMTNGSLETHLFNGRNGAAATAATSGGLTGRPGSGVALGWRDRVRITSEVAAALLFLHSAPTPIVHMDLKPANILLDEHLTAKLGDVGLARLVPTLGNPAGPAARSTAGGGVDGREGAGAGTGAKSSVQDTRLVGTFEYMDPEYLRTGGYSARSDLYALGLVMLQLLTGREGGEVVSLVEAARRQPLSFSACIDPRAGQWPAAEAVAFADLALRCAQVRRQDRPDLRAVVLPTLVQLRQRTQLYDQPPAPSPRQPAPGPVADAVPPMFLCPITQDIMEEPVVAADGYTYERLAIAEWITRSKTSPLTNMPLEHVNLVDNRTLRSAIKEWREQQQWQQQQQQQHHHHHQQQPGQGGSGGGAALPARLASQAQAAVQAAVVAPPPPLQQQAVVRQDSGGW